MWARHLTAARCEAAYSTSRLVQFRHPDNTGLPSYLLAISYSIAVLYTEPCRTARQGRSLRDNPQA